MIGQVIGYLVAAVLVLVVCLLPVLLVLRIVARMKQIRNANEFASGIQRLKEAEKRIAQAEWRGRMNPGSSRRE